MSEATVDGNPEEGREVSTVKAYFAPGKAATHKRGVLYQGDYQNESDGTGIAIRLHARALASTGVPLLLKPASSMVLSSRGVFEPLHLAGISEGVKAEVGDLPNTSVAALYPVIRHFVVHKAEDINSRVMRGATSNLDDPEIFIKLSNAAYSGTVLYSVWERDRVDARIVREMNRVGDNWVPCEQNAEMLRKCGVERVAVIPHPFDFNNQLTKLTKRRPMKTRRFYNIGRWEPRKNQVEILLAFFETFKPGDDVHLTMKFHGSWEGYPNLAQTLEYIHETHSAWTPEQVEKHLTTIEGHVRADQILKLHYENNIYLAPSAGEAWCLPAFEAKVAGNKLIHTPYGGTADFCEAGDVALGYELGPVPPTYGWSEDSEWAHVSGTSLRAALGSVEAPEEYVRTVAFSNKFGMPAVGHLMRARLKEIFGNTPSGEYLK